MEQENGFVIVQLQPLQQPLPRIPEAFDCYERLRTWCEQAEIRGDRAGYVFRITQALNNAQLATLGYRFGEIEAKQIRDLVYVGQDMQFAAGGDVK